MQQTQCFLSRFAPSSGSSACPWPIGPLRFLLCHASRGTRHAFLLLAFLFLVPSPSPAAEPDPFARFRIEPEPEPPPDPFISPTWLAHWIWSPGQPGETTRYFRKTVDLAAEPESVHLAITAGDSYVLTVNGRPVAHDEDWTTLEDLDVTRHFHKGPNVLAVLVRGGNPATAGLLLQGEAALPPEEQPPAEGEPPRERDVVFFTNTSWLVSPTLVPGWESPAFDDKAWARAESRGKHPCPPWGSQGNTWRLAYHGPKWRLYLDDFDYREVLKPREPFEITLTVNPIDKIPTSFPFSVEIAGKDGRRWRIGLVRPDPPAETWEPRHEVITNKMGVYPPQTLFLVPGRYDLFLRPTAGIYANRRSDRIGTLLIEPYDRDLAWAGPLPRREAERPSGEVVDTQGIVHRWTVTEKNALLLNGEEVVPVDGSAGVYVCTADVAPGLREPLAALASPDAVADIARDGLAELPVRSTLVDTIDCTKADRLYSDDLGHGGESRVITLTEGQYRVTSARKATSYFAMTAFIQTPYRPHVFVFETPNDIERYTFIRIQPPWDNVGGGVYTGREYPLDGKPRKQMFLFYPRQKAVRFTVSRIPAERDLRPESGAAVSRIWILEITDQLKDRSPAMYTGHGGAQRRIGLSCSDAESLLTLYGRDARRDTEHHRLALLNFLEYLRFVGLNHLEINATSRRFETFGRLLSDLLALTDNAGVSVVPWVDPLAAPGPRQGADALSDRLRRLGEACRDHPSVVGLGVRCGARSPLPASFWPEARSIVRRAGRTGLFSNRGWDLYALTDLPSDSPDRNIAWPAGTPPRELLGRYGLEAIRSQRGVVLQQALLADADRYCESFPADAPERQNAWAYKAFDYAPGLARLYETREPAAVAIRHQPWRETGIWKDGEFGTECWGAGTASPVDRYAFQPLTHALRTANPRDLVLGSPERGSFGHEHDLRAFARCFRALPSCEPRPYKGPIEEKLQRAWDAAADPRPARDRSLLGDGALWVRWFGDRLALVNDSPHAREVTLRWDGQVRRGSRLADLATLRSLVAAETESVRDPSVTVRLRPFDLHTLVVLPLPRPLIER